MADDGKLELLRAHRTAADKYTYFLLAAAGAAIGFALNQTRESERFASPRKSRSSDRPDCAARNQTGSQPITGAWT
jgi:hypothetical protein